MFKMAALRFKPVNKKHSIEDFFLGVRFGRQLTEATFTRAVIEARRLAAAHNLPAENQQANFLFSADTAVAMQTLPAAAFNPLFQRFNASGGVEEELRLERNFVGYRTSSYSRWQTITAKLEALVLPLAQLYASEAPYLDSTLIQYVDRFTSTDHASVDWSELFRQDTPWVARGMLSTVTSWHSHCGRFEPIKDDTAARRLINVNVDVGEPVARPGAPTMHSVAILTLCSDHFLTPGIAPRLIDTTVFPSELRSRFDGLHDRAKDVLMEVLADAYLEQIDLTAAGSAP